MNRVFFHFFAAALPSVALAQEVVDFPGDARLMLPPVIHALEGLEVNLYFDNAFLLLNPAAVAVDVNVKKGAQQTERWTWTPQADESGEYPLSLELRDSSNAVVARASSVVQVRSRAFAGSRETPLSLLVIGDSLTAASVYPARILELAKEDGLPLHLVGTRGPGVEEGSEPGEVRHEGYGGWTAERFATHFTGKARGGPYRECGSPFLYKTDPANEKETPKLDFPRYIADTNEGIMPDYVTILLGCNDTFHATDETIEERIDVFERHMETLIAMIRESAPATRIGLVLPMPPAGSQDAFGANYGSGQTRWQYQRNRHRLVERMASAFSNREDGRIHLVPAHLNLDPVHGFPSVTVPANARSETQVGRLNNGVHPSAEGYRQIGDAIYAWVRSFDQEKRTQ